LRILVQARVLPANVLLRKVIYESIPFFFLATGPPVQPSSKTTARAAMPSSLPVKPRCSVVVALMLT